MEKNIFGTIHHKVNSQHKLFALLIDPDKHNNDSLARIACSASSAGVDFIFVGGSLLQHSLADALAVLKGNTGIPLVLFPGNHFQIDGQADAILYLSLISGRNPDFLIGQHVLSAFNLKRSGLEVIPTAYILIDGGKRTSVQYISNTQPIPADKPDIVVATALAGEMLGLKLVYLEAGSGAIAHAPLEVIAQLRSQLQVPIIVGGGIRTPQQVADVCRAGADVVVVGTAIEQQSDLLEAMVLSCHSFSS